MKNTYKRGFTLIELLVVIAIIGILASVVLASLNTARDKGADAAAKSNLSGIRAESNIFYENNSSTYTGVCADPNIAAAQLAAQTAIAPVAVIGGLGDGECFVDPTGVAWAAWSNLRADSGNAWCIDSTGIAKAIPAQDSSLVDLSVCP